MIERVTISLEKKIAEDLRLIAKQEGKPVSKMVKEAIEEFILYRKRRQLGEKLLRLIEEKGPQVDEEEALKEIEQMRKEWR